MGIFGPMIINGPATADYDEDLGVITLQDWAHQTAFSLWNTAKQGAPPTMENGLINGTNTYNCTSTDTCTGIVGKKFETRFQAGKKYRIRLVNVATDGHFQFSIDGHSLTVIANDLVPIRPYAADAVQLTMGQRYDVIVEASASPGDYWLRGAWIDACMTNGNSKGITGIVRYDNSSTAAPTSTSNVTTTASCNDEPFKSLVPHVAMDVGTVTTTASETLNFKFDTYFKWTLNGSSLLLDWANPTITRVVNGSLTFPTDYNVVSVNGTSSDWAMRKHEPSLIITPPPLHCVSEIISTIRDFRFSHSRLLTHFQLSSRIVPASACSILFICTGTTSGSSPRTPGRSTRPPPISPPPTRLVGTWRHSPATA